MLRCRRTGHGLCRYVVIVCQAYESIEVLVIDESRAITKEEKAARFLYFSVDCLLAGTRGRPLPTLGRRKPVVGTAGVDPYSEPKISKIPI